MKRRGSLAEARPPRPESQRPTALVNCAILGSLRAAAIFTAIFTTPVRSFLPVGKFPTGEKLEMPSRHA
jgi:hypothetical protein